jgi:hypothetical protein
MSHNIASLKPLFLTEDEALALLDLSLMSSVENDPIKERAMLKLTDLVRRYLSTGQETSEETQALATEVNLPEPKCSSLPAGSLLHTLSESGSTSARTSKLTLNRHTDDAPLRRGKRRPLALAFVD